MKIKDLAFTEFITEEMVQLKVQYLASEIDKHYAGKTPVFLPVLNGAFMFAADMMKHISIPCRVSFVKVSSYDGISSTGRIKTLIGFDENLINQDIIIIEDIVDTGLTLHKIVEQLHRMGTKSIEVVSLLRKKPAREKGIHVKYTGFEIENEFVLGYGLDYDGLGRNYRQIYKVV